MARRYVSEDYTSPRDILPDARHRRQTSSRAAPPSSRITPRSPPNEHTPSAPGYQRQALPAGVQIATYTQPQTTERRVLQAAPPHGYDPSPSQPSGYELISRNQVYRTIVADTNTSGTNAPNRLPNRPRAGSRSTQDRDSASVSRGRASLSADLLAFIRIPYTSFDECRRFIDDHEAVLNVADRTFIDAANQARRDGDRALVQQCIDRLVLVRECRQLSADGRDHYLRSLAARNSTDLRNFYDAYNSLSNQVQGDAHPPTAAPVTEGSLTASRGLALNRDYRPLDASGRTGYDPAPEQQISSNAGMAIITSARQNDRGPEPYRRASATSTTTTRIASSAISATQPPPISYTTSRRLNDGPGWGRSTSARGSTAAENGEPEAQRISSGYRGSKSQKLGNEGRGRPRPSGGAYEDDEVKRKLPTAGGLENVEFKGSQQVDPPDMLKPDFIHRRDPDRFFRIGRVFAMVWHENAGLQHGKPAPSAATSSGTSGRITDGPYGQPIHTGIRRMVVLQPKHGYCKCIPIISYGDRGTVPKNMDREELEAHAIIYGGRRPPAPLEGEHEYSKHPIKVNLKSGESLFSSSRIHFGKMHTVQYNIRVKDIGFIARESMAEYEGYAYQELAIDTYR